jgi:hypothetical protein
MAQDAIRIELPNFIGSVDADVRGLSYAQGAGRYPRDLGRTRGEPCDNIAQTHTLFIHQAKAQGQEGLERRNSWRGGGEGGLLGVQLVRLMIRADRAQRVPCYPLSQAFEISVRA